MTGLACEVIYDAVKFIIMLLLLAGGVVIGGKLRTRSDAKKEAKNKEIQEDKEVQYRGVNELRRMFLDFFESKGHLKMKSFSGVKIRGFQA